MDVFFLLIFLAFLFVMAIGALLYWAVMSGQFDNSDQNASSILQDEEGAAVPGAIEQSQSARASIVDPR